MSDKLNALFEDDDLGLLNTPKRVKPQTSSDRLESSFLEIVDFYNENEHKPSATATDMAERKLGVRLHGIRADDEKVEALKHLDAHGLLVPEEPPESFDEVLRSDDLGLLDDPTGILTLKNVPSRRDLPDYVARQKPSKDFKQFEPIFLETQRMISSGRLSLRKITSEYEVEQQQFYILRGILTYVADMEERKKSKAKMNARLRVIYENGTESNIKARSFARALYRNGYVVTNTTQRNLSNSEKVNTADKQTGFIYVLKSLNQDPRIGNVSNLYKIGFSAKPISQRIKNAINDPTYLMGEVDVVASYHCYNFNPQKFEALIHKFFNDVRVDLVITDNNGKSYTPSEWYAVPLPIIDRAIQLIINGEIVYYQYDSEKQELYLIDGG
jgi:hypothetical protein